MFLSDYDYALPDELIARYPTTDRRASRMLVVDQEIKDRQFADLKAYLRPDDLLVFNNTRVIRARIRGAKATGGKTEVLIERLLNEKDVLAQVRASKPPKAGSAIELDGGCKATVLGRRDNLFVLRFSEAADQYLEHYGEIPLPPYLNRDAESADSERYQTVYAELPGAVAAPTAGLHFDTEMLAETKAIGVRHAFLTLHVGAGTFQPLRENQIDNNRLHPELVQVNEGVCNVVRETKRSGGRVIAVGTTSVRALESASASSVIAPLDGETDIFIAPGFEFQTVDAMLTNFHLPKSSLLMLVAAFAGYEKIMQAYQHAVAERYRFFSYGDVMLLLNKPK